MSATRSVLFVGDVTGDAGVDLACRRIAELRDEHRLDAVVVNAENAATDGMGMPESALQRLLASGADVVTGGNHSWDHPDSARCLEHPRVVRPLNVDRRHPGRGAVTVPLGERPLTVINVADLDAIRPTPAAPDEVTDVLQAIEDALGERDRGDVIVDVHAEHVFTKQALAHALDGRVTAVLGTHTHEATLRLRRLPGGTAAVTEVGMTGCLDGVMGFTPEAFVRGLRSGVVMDGRAIPTSGAAQLAAVLLRIDGHGRTTDIARVA